MLAGDRIEGRDFEALVDGYLHGDPAAPDRTVRDQIEGALDGPVRQFAHRLYGSYAVALRRGGELVLAHDHFGLKPVYYHLDGDCLAFSTSLGALADLVGADEIDHSYFRDLIAFGEHAGTRTPFRAIRMLEAGETFRWNGVSLAVDGKWILTAVGLSGCRSSGRCATRRLARVRPWRPIECRMSDKSAGKRPVSAKLGPSALRPKQSARPL